MPPSIPRIDQIRVDGSILAVTLALSLAVALLASVVPALAASGRSLPMLSAGPRFCRVRPEHRAPRAGRRAVRPDADAAQVRRSMIRSYWTVRTMDTGFRTADVLTMRLDVSGPRYKRAGARRRVLRRDGQARRACRRDGCRGHQPASTGRRQEQHGDDRGPRPGPRRGPLVENRVITPGYFDTMGIRLVSGRALTNPMAPPTTCGRRHQPDDGPARLARASNPWASGFVSAMSPVDDRRRRCDRHAAVGHRVPRKAGGVRNRRAPFQSELSNFVMQAATDPTSLVGAVAARDRRIDSGQPVADMRTMGDVVDTAIAERRFGAMLVGLFASTALMLVLAAIYALMAFSVAQRTPEIGVRMAFGATPVAVLRLVMRSALSVTGAGAAAGLVGAVLSAKAMRAVVYGFSPDDPLMLMLGAVGLVAIGLAGALVPALRATRVDPITALRAE